MRAIGLLHWGHEPPFDVVQHPRNWGVLRHRLHEGVMRNVVKQPFNVKHQDPIVPPTALAGLGQRIMRRPSGAIPERVRMKVGFDPRLEGQLNHIALRLHRPTANEREVENIADLAAMALNQILGQGALSASSLLRFPNGIHRDIFHQVSPDDLRVPPLFFAKCVLAGVGIDTFYREEDPRVSVSSDHRVIQSHFPAIDEVLRERGPRGGFTDFDRRREPLDSLLKAMYLL